MWVGFFIGYAYHFGWFKKFEMGIARATALEKKFPFKHAVEKPYFISASMACGGQVYPGMGGFLGGGSSAQEQPAADNEAAASTANNSSAANFKAFAGKGTSIGGTDVAVPPPRFDSNGASASRGRSTPATRAASAAGSSADEYAAPDT